MYTFKFITLTVLILATLSAMSAWSDDEDEIEATTKQIFVNNPSGFNPFVLQGIENLMCPDDGGNKCPDPSIVYRFVCCGHKEKECCMRFQDWTLIFVGLASIFVVVYLVARCIHCIARK